MNMVILTYPDYIIHVGKDFFLYILPEKYNDFRFFGIRLDLILQ